MGLNERRAMVFGCGNVIMGDDGFGPAVVDQLLADFHFPEDIQAVDVGTCLRDYLFDYLLSEEGRPEDIIILDAVDYPQRHPGELFTLLPAQIPAKKIHDFSLHQFPTVNLLQELEQYTGIKVRILAAQVDHIPNEIAPGLSPAMTEAVGKACQRVSQLLSLKAR